MLFVRQDFVNGMLVTAQFLCLFVSVCESFKLFQMSMKKKNLLCGHLLFLGSDLAHRQVCTQTFGHSHTTRSYAVQNCMCQVVSNLEARATPEDCTWNVVLTRYQQPTLIYPHRPTYIYAGYLALYFHNKDVMRTWRPERSVKKKIEMISEREEMNRVNKRKMIELNYFIMCT